MKHKGDCISLVLNEPEALGYKPTVADGMTMGENPFGSLAPLLSNLGNIVGKDGSKNS